MGKSRKSQRRKPFRGASTHQPNHEPEIVLWLPPIVQFDDQLGRDPVGPDEGCQGHPVALSDTDKTKAEASLLIVSLYCSM
jgi:hypothetical protein